MTDGLVRRNGFNVATLFQFTVMMLTVSAVLHVVQIVSCFLAEQTKLLGACNMELLLATGFVALHTGSRS